ncbi:hypothetical protein mRhiFer1_010121 [Rhinolophus ferrumequinum]|uniref:Uncharacterized protein n=1 Tax=Rhinolophus ferrumequinum TaxID=59479 RepID=A0A7J7XPC6_RHIFE|nr:hypothetical protein mRhiFer1_010121 [Rhinolophus ferrumequinum]
MPGDVGARRERPRPLCGARDPGRLDGSRVRRKESTGSEGCGGGLGDRAEPHREAWNLWRVRGGVSSAAEYREREGAGPARGGPGNAPGRASSAGLAGRTRSGRARDTNASQRDARQKQSPAEPGSTSFVSTSGRLSGPRSHSLDRTRKGLSTRGHPLNPLGTAGRLPERTREPGVSLESCVGGRTEVR